MWKMYIPEPSQQSQISQQYVATGYQPSTNAYVANAGPHFHLQDSSGKQTQINLIIVK